MNNKLNTAFDYRYGIFMQNIVNTNIQNYFDISYDDNEKICFSLSKEESCLVFTIKYNNDENDLCIEIQTQITYPERYPFDAPLWKLRFVTINDDTSANLTRHYDEIVQLHNKKNNEDWSPIIYVEKDILGFIVKIADFQFLYT